jgi:hypothetical protein
MRPSGIYFRWGFLLPRKDPAMVSDFLVILILAGAAACALATGAFIAESFIKLHDRKGNKS